MTFWEEHGAIPTHGALGWLLNEHEYVCLS